MIKLMFRILFLFVIAVSCNENRTSTPNFVKKKVIQVDFAQGFEALNKDGYTVINLKSPWKDAVKPLRYLLLGKGENIPKSIEFDELIRVPIDKIVVTSTTHIPAIEALGELEHLVGFPNTDYISSKEARKLIRLGKIIDVGKSESLNLETLLSLAPEVVVGFGIESPNKALSNIKKFGIPVLYNSEWLEKHPLGRAEWIKFFGLLFEKEEKANEIFNSIKKEYLSTKELAEKAENKPIVLSGMPYKDTWYLPNGNSWAAQFYNDANANYLWSQESGSGSIVLNFETVFDKAKNADFWIAIADYQNKNQLLNSNSHYDQFKMFQENNIYISNIKGENGGLLFYELAPNRPDLVLKDLVKIFHPDLLPNYQLNFYSKLN